MAWWACLVDVMCFRLGLRPRRASVSGPLSLYGDGVQFLTSGSACCYLALTA